MINKPIDMAYAIKFLRTLTKDWVDMEAYKTGVLDASGNVVVKKHDQSQAQRDSYSKFDVLVWNLKRLLEKIPAGKLAMSRYAAAFLLLRETTDQDTYDYIISEMKIDNDLYENFTAGIDMTVASTKIKTPDEDHAGDAVFHVDKDSYHKSIKGKAKYARFKTYVGEDETGKSIRHYALRNPNKNIILKDKDSGNMVYLRRKQ